MPTPWIAPPTGVRSQEDQARLDDATEAHAHAARQTGSRFLLHIVWAVTSMVAIVYIFPAVQNFMDHHSVSVIPRDMHLVCRDIPAAVSLIMLCESRYQC